MKFREKSNESGVIKYKIPNIPQMMILLGHMGITPNGVTTEGQDLLFIGKMLNHIEFLVSEVSLKTKDGFEVKTYQEALEHMEFMGMLSEVAVDILQAMEVSSEKKN